MKTYEKPVLIELEVEIEDVIAKSGIFGDDQVGDFESPFPF